MTEISGFDLNALTRRIVATRPGETWSVDDLADAILDATPRNSLKVAYRATLQQWARQALALRTDPRLGQSAPESHIPVAEAGTNSGVDQAAHDTHIAVVGAGQNLARSRAALTRARYRERIFTGIAGERKLLLDCTVEEILFAAEESDRVAANNAAAAERYRRLVKLMQEHGAATPADLPADVLEEALPT